jgi:hypothetical protein
MSFFYTSFAIDIISFFHAIRVSRLIFHFHEYITDIFIFSLRYWFHTYFDYWH